MPTIPYKEHIRPKGTYKLLSVDPKYHWYHLQYPDGHIVEMRWGCLGETEVTMEHVEKTTHRNPEISNPHVIVNREFYYGQGEQEWCEYPIFLEEVKKIRDAKGDTNVESIKE
jgi:hypothetical protein